MLRRYAGAMESALRRYAGAMESALRRYREHRKQKTEHIHPSSRFVGTTENRGDRRIEYPISNVEYPMMKEADMRNPKYEFRNAKQIRISKIRISKTKASATR